MSTPYRPELGIPPDSLQPVMNGSQRRAQITADIAERTGIDDAMIQRLVHAFYAKIRKDAFLGPVFHSRVGSRDLHLARH
jgi:hemoglobin